MKPKIAILLPTYGMVNRGTENFTTGFVKYLSPDFDISIFTKVKTSENTRPFFSVSSTNQTLQLLYKLFPWKKILDVYCLNPDHIEALIFSLSVLPHLLSHKYDLLFPQTGFWGALLCRIIRGLKGTPYIYRSAGGIEPLVAAQKPDIYFCINPGITAWFKKYFPHMRSIFISNGVDMHRFNPKGKKAVVNLPRPVIMTASALIQAKRVDLTIKAVGHLKEGSLLVIGVGPLRRQLEKLAEDEIGAGRFLFTDGNYQTMPQYYRTADLFAFSAPDELGWGLVHLEALASGLTVVANNEENLQFLMGRNAYLCDVRDVKRYTQTLKKALLHKIPLRKKVLAYSWEKIAQEYKKYLYEIIYSK